MSRGETGAVIQQDSRPSVLLGPARIAFLFSKFPILSETFIMQEVLELERQGASLHLFSLAEPAEDQGGNVSWSAQTPLAYLSRHGKWRLLGSALQRFFKAPWRFLRAGIQGIAYHRQFSAIRYLLYASYLARRFERQGISHVHAHFATEPTSIALSLHLLTGISYSFSAHAYDIYLSPRGLLEQKMRLARFVVTCTTYNQRYLREINPRLAGHIHCIYHGLRLELFPSADPAARVPVQPPLILAVARLLEKKGLTYLLQACRILDEQGYDFTCRIVGEGPLHQRLEEEIRTLRLAGRVVLWGAASHQEVIGMYQQVSVVALPCMVARNGDRDGIPNVLVEALCMGIPVVSTSVSGIPELIESETNGLLVPPQDSAALATALARLLNDAELRSRLAAAGQLTVYERFNMARNATQLLHLLYTEKEPLHAG